MIICNPPKPCKTVRWGCYGSKTIFVSDGNNERQGFEGKPWTVAEALMALHRNTDDPPQEQCKSWGSKASGHKRPLQPWNSKAKYHLLGWWNYIYQLFGSFPRDSHGFWPIAISKTTVEPLQSDIIWQSWNPDLGTCPGGTRGSQRRAQHANHEGASGKCKSPARFQVCLGCATIPVGISQIMQQFTFNRTFFGVSTDFQCIFWITLVISHVKPDVFVDVYAESMLGAGSPHSCVALSLAAWIASAWGNGGCCELISFRSWWLQWSMLLLLVLLLLYNVT